LKNLSFQLLNYYYIVYKSFIIVFNSSCKIGKISLHGPMGHKNISLVSENDNIIHTIFIDQRKVSTVENPAVPFLH